MNIHQAAFFLKEGFLIRRKSWEEGAYVSELCGMLERHEWMKHTTLRNSKSKTTKHLVRAPVAIELEELLALDWEVIEKKEK